MTAKKQDNTAYGVASVSCAIISFFILGIVFAPIAAIIGIIGCSKANNTKDQTLSVIGLVLGIIFTIVCLFSLMSIRVIR